MNRAARMSDIRNRVTARAVPTRPGGLRPNFLDNWRLLGLAAALEAKELVECENARMRLVLERVRRINPTMMRNVEGSM